MIRLIKDADIYSTNGEKIGNLDRVVLDPETKKVSFLIVKEGLLFPTSKVIPMSLFDLEGEQIKLSDDALDMDSYPEYDASVFVGILNPEVPEDAVESVVWYPPVNGWDPYTRMMYPTPVPKYVRRTNHVIPEDCIVLDEGASVVTKDDQKIGNVERVIVEPKDNRATHIVVGSGLLTKEFKLVPSFWIKTVMDDSVHLAIDSSFFEKLPEYEPVS